MVTCVNGVNLLGFYIYTGYVKVAIQYQKQYKTKHVNIFFFFWKKSLMPTTAAYTVKQQYCEILLQFYVLFFLSF